MAKKYKKRALSGARDSGFLNSILSKNAFVKNSNTKFYETLMTWTGNSKLRAGVSIMHDALEPLIKFTKTPSFLGGAHVISTIVEAYLRENRIYADDYFHAWFAVCNSGSTGLYMQLIQKYGNIHQLKLEDDNYAVWLGEIDGCSIGYLTNKWEKATNRSVSNLHTQANPELVHAKLNQLFWQEYHDQNVLIRKQKSHDDDSRPSEQQLIIQIDTAKQAIESEKAAEITDYLQSANAHNINRSLLLYGPPGTGKSTLGKTIVDKLGYRCVRFRFEDIETNHAQFIDLIASLNADAIIIDDIDRVSYQPKLLETLEFFQEKVKILIATANKRSDIDEALLRPGRFDEIIYIEHLGDNVIKHLLGDDQAHFDVVKTWPIAFVQEFIKRRQFINDEQSLNKAINELQERIERLSDYRQETSNVSASLNHISTKQASNLKKKKLKVNP